MMSSRLAPIAGATQTRLDLIQIIIRNIVSIKQRMDARHEFAIAIATGECYMVRLATGWLPIMREFL